MAAGAGVVSASAVPHESSSESGRGCGGGTAGVSAALDMWALGGVLGSDEPMEARAPPSLEGRVLGSRGWLRKVRRHVTAQRTVLAGLCSVHAAADVQLVAGPRCERAHVFWL